MSWFNEVTGSNDFERQSWRDNFNGGAAAGDWTGNTNARLDAERDAFGTTWSGSSSEPSALELARSFVGRDGARGSGLGVVTSGGGSSGAGTGNRSVAVGAPQDAGSGAGRRVVVGGGDGPSKVTSVFTGGNEYPIDRGWSDAADAEDRWGEAEFLTPGWFYNWGVWSADTIQGAKEYLARPNDPKQTRDLLEALPSAPSPWLRDFVGGVGEGFAVTGPTREADLPNPMQFPSLGGY